MNFSSAVTSVTRDYIVPKVYDTITKGSPTLMTLLQNAKDWKTGTNYKVIYKYADSTNGGTTGIADKLDTNRENVRVQGSFEPKMAYKPVVLASIEKTLNMGDEQIVDLLETEFDSQAQSLLDVMSEQLFRGTSTGDSWDSLDNAADDGTNYGTYAGLSRTTYTSLSGYYLASAGALTLDKLATAFDNVEIGTDMPTHIVTTKTLWSAYEALLTPTVRAGYSQSGYPTYNAFGMVPSAKALAGNQGFGVVFYRGVPVIKDEQCPSGRLYLLNTKCFKFVGIDLSKADKNIRTVNFKKTTDGVPAGVPGNVPSTRGFNFRDLMSPVDQLAEVGHIIYAGNFVSTNPRLLGQMRGLTA